MARKIVNRKALREEVEAAEKADAGKKKVVVAEENHQTRESEQRTCGPAKEGLLGCLQSVTQASGHV